MSGPHTGTVGVEEVAARHSPVHHLDPRVKIVGLIALTVVAVTTPPGAWIAFAAYGAVLLGLVVAARLPAGYVVRRMTVEVPFLVAAALLPLTVPDGEILGGTVASKATIGVLAMVVLSSTTPFPRLLRGFEALRAPRLLVMIVSFMWRYLHVIGDEVRRARLARMARGYDPRWLWQAGAVARHVATLFVRSFERGERVYLAMLSRGYSGGIPATLSQPLSLDVADIAFASGLAGILALIRIALT
jgi:cobalt/nickel transport system permease protein